MVEGEAACCILRRDVFSRLGTDSGNSSTGTSSPRRNGVNSGGERDAVVEGETAGGALGNGVFSRLRASGDPSSGTGGVRDDAQLGTRSE